MSLRVEFVIPRDLWLSSNVQTHYRKKSKVVRELRARAALVGRGVTAPVPVDVVAHIGYPTARKADPPNAWPTVKALLDGLTDAGVWPDDNSEYIPETAFRRGQKSPAGTYRVVLDIRPATVKE